MIIDVVHSQRHLMEVHVNSRLRSRSIDLYSGIRISGITVRFLGKSGKAYLPTFVDT